MFGGRADGNCDRKAAGRRAEFRDVLGLQERPREHSGECTRHEKRRIAVRDALDVNLNLACFLDAWSQAMRPDFEAALKQAAVSNYSAFIKALETRRTDKQAGSSTGGTTSLVSKGVTAQTLSVGTEYGALTESVNKQVITMQGTLGGIASALVRQHSFQYCPKDEVSLPGEPCVDQTELSYLKRLSFGMSFDTSQGSQAMSGSASRSTTGSTQPVTFTASGHEITSWNGRFVIVSRDDHTSNEFQKV
jgi:hypothetical protein